MRNSYRLAALLLIPATGACAMALGLDKDFKETDGGSDAAAAVTLEPAPPSCPTNLPGPVMVPLPGNYCIDSTEVTWADYDLWWHDAEDDQNIEEPYGCDWNDTFAPKEPMDSGEEAGARPVAYVDWCDAWTYCNDIGKRLCGAIGGEELPWDNESYKLYYKSQWMNACSSGGKNIYTYGNDLQDKSCNSGNNQVGQSVPAGSMGTCQSSIADYRDVFDLTGNVWEWEDSCSGDTSGQDLCRARGGCFDPQKDVPECAADRTFVRSSQNSFLGFRCCTI